MVTPGLSLPMPLNPKPARITRPRSNASGRIKSGSVLTTRKPRGMTPTIWRGRESTMRFPSDYRSVSPKMTLPVSIAEHDRGGTPRETKRRPRSFGNLVGRQEPTAGRRWNPERLQHSVTHRNRANLLRLRQARDVRGPRSPHAERLKCPVLLGVGEIHRWREGQSVGPRERPPAPLWAR